MRDAAVLGFGRLERTPASMVLLPTLLLLLGPLTVVLSLTHQAPSDRVVILGAIVVALPVVTWLLLRSLGAAWDPILLGSAWVLTALGLTTVARVRPLLLDQQLLWIILGWCVFIGVVLFPSLPELLRRYRYTWLALGLVLALATFAFGYDPSGTGLRLWLRVGPITIQPSEVLRVLLIVFLAAYLDERRDLFASIGARDAWLRLPPLEYALPLVAMVGLTILVVAFQRDLGPALLYAASFLAMLYLATGRPADVALGFGFFGTGAAAVALVSSHVQSRISIWLDPWNDPQGAGYQGLQAIGGLAYGGVTGAGPGYGHPTLIPAAHTDYPFAAIGEEWGLLGTLAILLLYAIFASRALTRAAALAPGRFEQLLAAGLTVSLALQVLIVLGGTLRLVPLTGITSPFLSYGGSSMLMSWAALGLILRLTHPAPRTPRAGVFR